MTSAPARPVVTRVGPDVPPLAASSRARRSAADLARDNTILPVLTLVLWLGCLVVGALGLALPYSRPLPHSSPPLPLQAEILNVELTDEPHLPPDIAPPLPTTVKPPPLVEPVALPPTPPMMAVATPNPAIAFELPVEGPARVVEAAEAAHAVAPPSAVVAPAPPVQAITYGQGEGKQPSPVYPPRALREGQEGTVRVRFSVGENGRVVAAEALTPSPWPLLNQEAVRVVRERWRFQPGSVRLYEVSIHFQLRK